MFRECQARNLINVENWHYRNSRLTISLDRSILPATTLPVASRSRRDFSTTGRTTRSSLTNILGNRVVWRKIFFTRPRGVGRSPPPWRMRFRTTSIPWIRAACESVFWCDAPSFASTTTAPRPATHARQRPVTRQESGARSICATRTL